MSEDAGITHVDNEYGVAVYDSYRQREGWPGNPSSSASDWL
jgi:hypothetical protein